MIIKLKNLKVELRNILYKLGFDGHPKLRVLELKKNRINVLTFCVGLVELRELYLAENKIKSV